MTDYEWTSVVLGGVAIVVNLLLFVLFALQLRALRQQVADARDATDRDHTRRRCQATTEFYASTLEKRSEFRRTLPPDRDKAAVRAFVDTLLADGGDGATMLTEYLSLFELLATSVNTKVLDRDTVERIAGGRIRAIAENYRPWIDDRRERYGDELYAELLALAAELEERRAKRLAAQLGRSPLQALEAS